MAEKRRFTPDDTCDYYTPHFYSKKFKADIESCKNDLEGAKELLDITADILEGDFANCTIKRDDDILEDLDTARRHYRHAESTFLDYIEKNALPLHFDHFHECIKNMNDSITQAMTKSEIKSDNTSHTDSEINEFRLKCSIESYRKNLETAHKLTEKMDDKLMAHEEVADETINDLYLATLYFEEAKRIFFDYIERNTATLDHLVEFDKNLRTMNEIIAEVDKVL